LVIGIFLGKEHIKIISKQKAHAIFSMGFSLSPTPATTVGDHLLAIIIRYFK